jgi:hypothetical protein
MWLADPVFSNPRPVAALQQVWEKRPEAIWQIILAAGAIELTIGNQVRAHHEYDCVLSDII